ncbi:MAG: CGNR zinc finger domain-containing protein [Gaiellaceae bacterium]
MPRYDVPKAAPEPLAIVQRFVNTTDLENEREWLSTPGELAAWLREAGLPLDAAPGEADLTRAHELREALRGLLQANNGRPLSPDAVSTFNAAAATARLSPELDERGAVRLEPYAHGVDAALGRIVAVALGAMLDGSWSRLKACRNCRWAFHDYSRNRSASWCSMLLCGGRQKTRAYRRRLKARQG